MNTLEQRAQSNGSNYRACRRFYNAIQKYSWDSFVPEILATVETQDEANMLEEFYISEYRSTDRDIGYNIARGGLNHCMSDESKALISKKAKERYSDITKNPMYGKKHSEESLRKQSECKIGANNPMYGTKWNENQRRLCGTKGKKLNLSDERKSELSLYYRNLGETTGLKPVICIDDGNEFRSSKEAADFYGVSKQSVCDNLKGRSKSCKGRHFKYLYS